MLCCRDYTDKKREMLRVLRGSEGSFLVAVAGQVVDAFADVRL